MREEGRFAKALGISRAELTEGLGWTGEPIVVTGGGKAGSGRPGQQVEEEAARGEPDRPEPAQG